MRSKKSTETAGDAGKLWEGRSTTPVYQSMPSMPPPSKCQASIAATQKKSSCNVAIVPHLRFYPSNGEVHSAEGFLVFYSARKRQCQQKRAQFCAGRLGTKLLAFGARLLLSWGNPKKHQSARRSAKNCCLWPWYCLTSLVYKKGRGHQSTSCVRAIGQISNRNSQKRRCVWNGSRK